MGRKGIRYDNELNSEIRRVVGNYNRKIDRMKKKGKEIIEEKVSEKWIKEKYRSRKELKDEIEKLKMYSERGIEDVIYTEGGIKVSKYQLKLIKKESKRLKQALTKDIRYYGKQIVKIFGEEQGGTLSSMGDEMLQDLRAARKALDKDIEKLDDAGFTRYIGLLRNRGGNREERAKRFKDNLIDMLLKMGEYYGYDENELEDIKIEIGKLTTVGIQRMYMEEKSIKAILDYYKIMIGKLKEIEPHKISKDVVHLYDNLRENISQMVKDYQ